MGVTTPTPISLYWDIGGGVGLRLTALRIIFAQNIWRERNNFVSLPSVRGEIRTNESICYYFALSQNAQETVWNKIRSEVIEM